MHFLSEVIRNDTLKAQRHSIPKDCRQQIRSQLFQQRENIDFDPALKTACKKEIKELCGNIQHGSGQVNNQNASTNMSNESVYIKMYITVYYPYC